MSLLGLHASSLLRFLTFLPPPSAGGFYEHLHTVLRVPEGTNSRGTSRCAPAGPHQPHVTVAEPLLQQRGAE